MALCFNSVRIQEQRSEVVDETNRVCLLVNRVTSLADRSATKPKGATLKGAEDDAEDDAEESDVY